MRIKIQTFFPLTRKSWTSWTIECVLALVALTALPAWPQANITGAQTNLGPQSPSDNGIFVDRPKVYDQATLQALLAAVEKNLASLNAFTSTNLTGGLGTLQGGIATQSALAGQLSTGGTTPTIPSLPTTPSFSVPTAFSPSSADLFSEETQLGFQIVSLQLLLQGARSDQVTPNTNFPRTLVTLGFPISVNVPPGYQYQNAVAEVEVSVCAPGDSTSESETPSLVTILPQAKTYNVASIVNKSMQLSGGAVAQVFNFGGSFLRGRQTYFLMQDQDTIAFQRPADGTCQPELQTAGTSYRPITFGWQFKPVLGEKVVRDGLRQVFVQLSFEPGSEGEIWCDKSINVRTRWRTYDRKTRRVGAPITGFDDFPEPEPNYNNPPTPSLVAVTDNGDGTVTVKASGNFKTGTYVRLGNLLLGSNSSTSPPPASGTPGSPSSTTQPSPTTQSPSNSQAPSSPSGSGAASNTPSGTTTPTTSSSAPSSGSQPSTVGSPSSAPTNATTLQIQATLQVPGTNQITNNASSSQTPAVGPNAGGASASSSQFLYTPGYILFSASASGIALNGAFLVDPDGLEAPVVAAPYQNKNLSCRISNPVPSTQRKTVHGGIDKGPKARKHFWVKHAGQKRAIWICVG